MCGITGFISPKGNEDYQSILREMTDIMTHRGPDGSGYLLTNYGAESVIGLGHRRLSIIDLSENGAQPFYSADGNLVIVFNGEIYNYRELIRDYVDKSYNFASASDTEVILALYQQYGERCLDFFNGMFAFCIYDKRENKLFVARDRMGIRPLYYYYDRAQGVFAFASEVKGLLRFPKIKQELNVDALYSYLIFRYVPNPETLFKQIMKVEPGHYLIYQNGQLSDHEYWEVQSTVEKERDWSTVLAEVEKKLQYSVGLRMVSDVPVGAFLSGGLDSSLIVAMMSRLTDHPVKTFSVGIEGFPEHSELPYARKVAEQYQTDHTELLVSHKDIRDNIQKLVWHRDFPISQTSDIPIFLLAQEAQKSVKVILTGEGSDELFAGYPKFAYDNFARNVLVHLGLNFPPVKGAIQRLPFKFRKIKLALNSLAIKDEKERFISWFASFDDEDVHKMLKANTRRADFTGLKMLGHSTRERMLYFDKKYWLPDNLLERGDKMLMAASVEGRFPFLEHNLVSYAHQIDDRLMIKNFSGKYIVKKIAEKYIPLDNIYRKKVGFYIPVGDWFRNEMKGELTDLLLSTDSRIREYFDAGYIEQLLASHIKGQHDYQKELWTLYNLEVWFRTFF